MYDAIVGGGQQPLVELAFTPLALVPEDAEQRFAFEGEPDAVQPYEAGSGRSRPRTTPNGADWSAHWSSTLGPVRRDDVRGWLWELWNEPDISYWRGTPEQFHGLYDVTAGDP